MCFTLVVSEYNYHISFPNNFTFYKWCVTKGAHCIVLLWTKPSVILLDVGQVLCPPGTDLSLYSGNVSITNGGRTCQPWADTTPNDHNMMGSHNYPVDGSVEAANNYCRNVYGTHMPWCLTMDPDRPYQDCYERICDGMDMRRSRGGWGPDPP